jgi:prevent-host-death family protein
MKKAGIYEAKSKFSQLIQEVRQGQEVIILDRGKPVAKLVGLEAPPESDVVLRFRQLRVKAKPVSQNEIREWLDAGRK